MSAETHEIILVRPKPPAESIQQMIASYFDQEAATYDAFNEETPKRKTYSDAINRVIAEDLRAEQAIHSVLSVAAGTGKREVDILNLHGGGFKITCTDISDAMCEIARERGLEAWAGAWENIEVPAGRMFDAALFLWAFGMLPTWKNRIRALAKIAQLLRAGGVLYVDVLNIDDVDEWGPRICEMFEANELHQHGYEKGDVFYRRIGADLMSYCHYFSVDEMKGLLEESGLKLDRLWHIGYGQMTGQVLAGNGRGSLLVKARRL